MQKLWQHENSSRNTTKALQLELTAAPHKNMYTKHSKAEQKEQKETLKKLLRGRLRDEMHQKNP